MSVLLRPGSTVKLEAFTPAKLAGFVDIVIPAAVADPPVLLNVVSIADAEDNAPLGCHLGSIKELSAACLLNGGPYGRHQLRSSRLPSAAGILLLFAHPHDG